MTPPTQVPVLLKITTMSMMVMVLTAMMVIIIIMIIMVIINNISIIINTMTAIIITMIIIIRATHICPAFPLPPECKAESRPLVAARPGQLCFLGGGGARFEGFVPGAGCPLGLPLATLANRLSMRGGAEAQSARRPRAPRGGDARRQRATGAKR